MFNECLLNQLALKTRLCALLAQGCACFHCVILAQSLSQQRLNRCIIHWAINVWKGLCFPEAAVPGSRLLRTWQGWRWADVGQSPVRSPLKPLPTHSPLSGEGWKPVSHRQSKEPSVLTQCPPRHWSVTAHSSTSKTRTYVSRPSQGSLGPWAASCGPYIAHRRARVWLTVGKG